MTARREWLVTALWASGCTLLFPIQDRPVRGAPDAGAPDAEADAPPDAADLGPCPDRPLEARMPDNCLGCGEPCGPGRPFCCLGTCCAEECGTVDNECSHVPELRPEPGGDADADTDADADADADADGCDHRVYETCLGCDRPCTARRPFCCGAICCTEECGSVPNDCSTYPPKPPGSVR